MITGFHNQFDNVALLLGLWSVLLIGDDFDKPVDRRKCSGLVLLGLSLMTKHILFAFPFWLAVKQKGLRDKCVVMFVPVLIFFVGFAPYWAQGHEDIIWFVFLYQPLFAAYLYHWAVPQAIQCLMNPSVFWLFLLTVFALILRKRTALESLLLYTCLMVAAVPATCNEYLAIPCAFACIFVNGFTAAYIVIAAVHIAAHADGPHLLPPHIKLESNHAIYALALALVWITWRKNLINLLEACRKEIHEQLGLKN